MPFWIPWHTVPALAAYYSDEAAEEAPDPCDLPPWGARTDAAPDFRLLNNLFARKPHEQPVRRCC